MREYVDDGLTGTNRDAPDSAKPSPPADKANTLVVTKLDRLARSVPDAGEIVDELTSRGVRLDSTSGAAQMSSHGGKEGDRWLAVERFGEH